MLNKSTLMISVDLIILTNNFAVPVQINSVVFFMYYTLQLYVYKLYTYMYTSCFIQVPNLTHPPPL